MVKSVVTIFLFLIFFASCNNDNGKVIIKGEISNLYSPYIISSYHNSDSITIDTVFVDEKGKFSYVQYIDTSRALTFYFNDYHTSEVIFLEKGVHKIKVNGDAILPYLLEVIGGEINNNLTRFKKENETLLKQRSLLISKFDDENTEYLNSNNIISEKERMALLNSLNHELAQKVENYILLNPEKISSVILINEFFKNSENPKTLERVLQFLKNDAANYPLTHKLKKHTEKLMISAEGVQMPYFQLIDDNGKTIYPNDFKNKYLLISFLSANSEESKENLKILKNAYAILDKDSIEFLSIFIDSDTFPIIKPHRDSIPWRLVFENKSWSSEIVDTYNINSVPFNILIDPKGEITTRDIPVNEIKNIIHSQTDKSKS